MSEAPEAVEAVETEDAGFDAEFEAARVAEGDEGEAEGELEAEADKPAVDWQKRAHDKEGLAAKERARRREAERQVRELGDRLAKLETATKPQDDGDDLLSIIDRLRDDDEDPITDLAEVKRALKAFKVSQARDAEAEAQKAAYNGNIQRLAAAMDEAESDFTEDHPDYPKALDHFRKARREEFEDMGYSGAALEQALGKDFIELAQRAIGGGRDPAEVVYNLAKKRGFLSGKAATDTKLREIAAAAATGTPAGGKNGVNRMTADGINRLKGAAYDAAWEKMREAERRAS